MKRWTILLGALLVVAGSLRADERLTVEAPTVMLAPGHLVVEALVEPDASNKSIEVTAESPEFYRSTEVALAGGASPRKTTFEFKDLPVGKYEIRARLLDAKGDQRAVVVRTLDVISYARHR
ncbi:MAG TPA: hypothetical protein VLV86_12410 [Vicinamibacterales bacterium]|nr:hypothetical protein [Vicinamibacterales bacterium]